MAEQQNFEKKDQGLWERQRDYISTMKEIKSEVTGKLYPMRQILSIAEYSSSKSFQEGLNNNALNHEKTQFVVTAVTWKIGQSDELYGQEKAGHAAR